MEVVAKSGVQNTKKNGIDNYLNFVEAGGCTNIKKIIYKCATLYQSLQTVGKHLFGVLLQLCIIN